MLQSRRKGHIGLPVESSTLSSHMNESNVVNRKKRCRPKRSCAAGEIRAEDVGRQPACAMGSLRWAGWKRFGHLQSNEKLSFLKAIKD
jgi:hypothetical protein